MASPQESGKPISNVLNIIDNFDPTTQAVNAGRGSIFRYVPAVGSPKLFWKTDDGLSTNWQDITAGGGGGGANQTLSNLTAPTAINVDLLPQDNTKNIGSDSLPFNQINVDFVKVSPGVLMSGDLGNVTASSTQVIASHPSVAGRLRCYEMTLGVKNSGNSKYVVMKLLILSDGTNVSQAQIGGTDLGTIPSIDVQSAINAGNLEVSIVNSEVTNVNYIYSITLLDKQ